MFSITIGKVALKSLTSNPLRTGLSMLGIIIGVAAVIAMLAIGAGAQKQVLDSITAMGTDLLIVRPGQAGLRGVSTGDKESLTLRDAAALLKELPVIKQAAPVVGNSIQIKYYNRNARSTLTGTAITYFSIRNYTLDKGRYFTEEETDTRRRVAVIGPAVVDNLFGSHNPLGETLKVNGINFKVIGILASKGDQGWVNPDDQVYIPYTTAMKQLLGVDYLRELDLQVQPGSDLEAAVADATRLLRRTHRIGAGMPEDFNIRNQGEILETADNFSRIFTILLGGIASISLLVGGIGIMNIMLVTVTERTREIGIRKAIGARNRDILTQFLLESVLLSGTGGLMGVIFGVGIAVGVDVLTDFPSILQPFSIVLSLGFAMGIGIFFGLYPAQRASKLDPIEALRYE